jgi:hypothetical protein
MGGSGGGYFTSDIKNLKGKMNIADRSIDGKEFEMEVTNFLIDFLSQCNNRDVETINTHLEEILKVVENEIDGHFDIRFGGSVSKNTFVDGISDVDTLLIINDSELHDKTPKIIKNTIAGRLSERYPKTKISVG